jgi:hypothetical protein
MGVEIVGDRSSFYPREEAEGTREAVGRARRRPRRSIVETLDGWSGFRLCGLRQKLRSSLPGVSFRGSSMARPVRPGLHLSRAPPPRWFICSLRPVGSTPCLPFDGLRASSLPRRLPTPPRGDAVGTVCGAEPSKCTGGTFTRAGMRFAGARVSGRIPRFSRAVLDCGSLLPFCGGRPFGKLRAFGNLLRVGWSSRACV